MKDSVIQLVPMMPKLRTILIVVYRLLLCIEDRYWISQKCQTEGEKEKTAPQSLMTRVAAGCTFLQRELQANSGVDAVSSIHPGVPLPFCDRPRRVKNKHFAVGP
jgi:hypothetical protein